MDGCAMTVGVIAAEKILLDATTKILYEWGKDMSNAEHLIENAIFAMKRGEDVMETMKEWHNALMLEETGMKAKDVYAMAQHVVYSLYDGNYPSLYGE